MHAKQLEDLIKEHWEELVAHVGVTADMVKDLEILIRPIKGSVTGRYSHKSIHGTNLHSPSRIEVDPRVGEWKTMLGVVAHELTHCMQYSTGKLTHSWDGQNCKWLSNWDGNSVKLGTTFAQYRALPWEAEARKFQQAFIESL